MRKQLLIFCLLPTIATLPGITAAFSKPAPHATPHIELVDTPEVQDKSGVKAQAVRLLDGGQYDTLEVLTDQFRESHATYSNGAPKLETFYESFSEPSNASEEGWQSLLKKLQQWVAASPHSVSAHLCLTEALIGYGFSCREESAEESVKEKGRRRFAEALDQASGELDKVADQRSLDPHWYCCRLVIALGQKWPTEEYNNLFDEAVSTFPDYHTFYFEKLHFLLPKWRSKPGDMEQFASDTANHFNDQFYAQLVINQMYFYKNVFKETKLSWARTRLGFQQLLTEYHNAPDVVQPFAVLAWQAADKKTFASLVPKIGAKVGKAYWHTKSQYAAALDWLAHTQADKKKPGTVVEPTGKTRNDL